MRLSLWNVIQQMRPMLSGSRLKESIHCPLPRQICLRGKEPGQTVSQCVWSHFSSAGAEGASQKFEKKRGQARLGQGEGRGESGEEQEKRTLPNPGEEPWPLTAQTTKGEPVPWHRGQGPKGLTKALGRGLRAWSIGWIKGREPGLMDLPSSFPGEEKICPDLSLLSCACLEHTGLSPRSERIFLGTQGWIMSGFVWGFFRLRVG